MMMKAEKEMKSNKQLLGKDEQKSWFIMQGRGDQLFADPKGRGK